MRVSRLVPMLGSLSLVAMLAVPGSSSATPPSNRVAGIAATVPMRGVLRRSSTGLRARRTVSRPRVAGARRAMAAARVPATSAEALQAGAPVPHRSQGNRPVCGLSALGMGMDFYHELDPRSPNPLVEASDVDDPTMFTDAPTTDDAMLPRAVAMHITTEGEMYSAPELVRLARHYGYRAVIVRNPGVRDITEALDRHHPVLMAFDAADGTGQPTQLRGRNAHWAVLEGHYVDTTWPAPPGGDAVFVATHSYNFTQPHTVFEADAFLRSSAQMTVGETDRADLRDMSQIRSIAIELLPPARFRALGGITRARARALATANARDYTTVMRNRH